MYGIASVGRLLSGWGTGEVSPVPATALEWGSGNYIVWGTDNYLTWG